MDKWIRFACYMCQTRDSEGSYSAVLTVPSPFMQVNKLYTVGHPFTNCALGTLGTVSLANSPGEDVELSNYIRMTRFQFAERRSQRCRAFQCFSRFQVEGTWDRHSHAEGLQRPNYEREGIQQSGGLQTTALTNQGFAKTTLQQKHVQHKVPKKNESPSALAHSTQPIQLQSADLMECNLRQAKYTLNH